MFNIVVVVCFNFMKNKINKQQLLDVNTLTKMSRDCNTKSYRVLVVNRKVWCDVLIEENRKKSQKRIKHCMDCRHNSAWKTNIVYKHEFNDCYSILAQFVQFSLV